MEEKNLRVRRKINYLTIEILRNSKELEKELLTDIEKKQLTVTILFTVFSFLVANVYSYLDPGDYDQDYTRLKELETYLIGMLIVLIEQKREIRGK